MIRRFIPFMPLDVVPTAALDTPARFPVTIEHEYSSATITEFALQPIAQAGA